MHQLIPAIGVSGFLALQVLAGGESAVSDEATAVSKAAAEVAQSTERSQALFGNKIVAISQLRALANEHQQIGWDGYRGVPISPIAVTIAEQLIRSLPDGLPLPEFAPEPDGAISFDWSRSRNQVFSLSVNQNYRLAYAWIDGADEGYAVAQFDGQNFPQRILDGVRSMFALGPSGIQTS